MLARACWYWNMPALNMAVAPLVFSSAGLFGNGGKTGGSPCQSDGGKGGRGRGQHRDGRMDGKRSDR